jgi:hypothetical protein
MFILTACQAAPTEVTPTETPAPAEPVLEIITGDGTNKSFSMDDLKALPATTGQAGIKSSTGEITLPTQFTGVALKDLIATIDNFDEKHGHQCGLQRWIWDYYSYNQVMNGDFISYDPGNGGDDLKNPVH